MLKTAVLTSSRWPPSLARPETPVAPKAMGIFSFNFQAAYAPPTRTAVSGPRKIDSGQVRVMNSEGTKTRKSKRRSFSLGQLLGRMLLIALLDSKLLLVVQRVRDAERESSQLRRERGKLMVEPAAAMKLPSLVRRFTSFLALQLAQCVKDLGQQVQSCKNEQRTTTATNDCSATASNHAPDGPTDTDPE